MIHITSLIEEYIAPLRKSTWNCDKNEFYLLESNKDIVVHSGQYYNTELTYGGIFIGKKMIIYNRNQNKGTSVKAIKFQTTNNNQCIISERISVPPSFISSILKEAYSQIRNLTLLNKLEEQMNSWFDISVERDNLVHIRNKDINGKIDNRLIIVNRYIRSNYQKALTLHDLAYLIKCNHVYLSNTYSKVFGISPIKHVQNLKMKRAKELLQNTDYQVGEIAIKLGYASCSQFTDLFKRYYDLTPMQFRRSGK
ncbi:helix-turn-helix domain-containing protein [Paenibacillus allorhizosphaerae]|uniref:HTH-type transcriptional activator RhaS n=1 Tax=Paenibacillus allorhizosphaerae TaxID=2849866 RepID=A0ABM8VUN5_9BACL|nr:AraC family transcriptional regulator [Paenibacillus allorhizosphaerae]CAG7658912.1 HTH-type transcriptional activator RhaS [Paenibacillus allorhizosphaerae]